MHLSSQTRLDGFMAVLRETSVSRNSFRDPGFS